jgi:hypothetical protein
MDLFEDPKITAKRLTGSTPIHEGNCPVCGKPGARWVYIVGIVVISHTTDADHDACPDVRRQRAVDKLLNPAMWDALCAEEFDKIAYRGVGEAPALGIIDNSAMAVSTTAEPEDPTSLYDKLREVFNKVNEGWGRPAPPPIVSPETLARHQAAADLPRAEWIAVGNPFQTDPIGPNDKWMWINWRAAEATPEPFRVDPFGSLMGRSLFRTGQFLARPNAKGDGFDIAEIMVTS